MMTDNKKSIFLNFFSFSSTVLKLVHSFTIMIEFIQVVPIIIGLLSFIGLNCVWLIYLNRKGELGYTRRLVPPESTPDSEVYEPQKDVVLEEFPVDSNPSKEVDQGHDRGAADSMQAHLSLYANYETGFGIFFAIALGAVEGMCAWERMDTGLAAFICLGVAVQCLFRSAASGQYVLFAWANHAPKELRDKFKYGYLAGVAATLFMMIAGAVTVATLLRINVSDDMQKSPMMTCVIVLPLMMVITAVSSDSLMVGWSTRNIISLVFRICESVFIAFQFVLLSTLFSST